MGQFGHLSILLLLTVCGSQAFKIEDFMRVCRYESWAPNRLGRGKFVPEDIDPFLCTHIIYVRAKLEGNRIVPYDANDESTTGIKGMYERFNDQAAKNPAMKTLLSVGGWDAGTSEMTAMLATPANRSEFISTSIVFLRERNFSGVELDFQFPGRRGSPAADKERFTILCKSLRAAFNREADISGNRRLLLAAAVSAKIPFILNAYQVRPICGRLDMVNLMAYDFHVHGDGATGHNAPLFDRFPVTGASVRWTTRYWRFTRRCHKRKFVTGMPTYGHVFNLTSSSDNAIGAPTSGIAPIGPYTNERGLLAYYEVCEFLQTGATVVWDSMKQASYAHLGQTWVSYEEPRSLRRKVQWLIGRRFRGWMASAIDMDDFTGASCGTDPYPLLLALNQATGVTIVRPATTSTPTTTTTTPATTTTTSATTTTTPATTTTTPATTTTTTPATTTTPPTTTPVTTTTPPTTTTATTTTPPTTTPATMTTPPTTTPATTTTTPTTTPATTTVTPTTPATTTTPQTTTPATTTPATTTPTTTPATTTTTPTTTPDTTTTTPTTTPATTTTPPTTTPATTTTPPTTTPATTTTPPTTTPPAEYYGSFGACSKTCNTGLQDRFKYCMDGNGGYEVCDIDSAQCNIRPCEDPFASSVWSTCSDTCGSDGHRQRTGSGGEYHMIGCNQFSCAPVVGACSADVVILLDSSGSMTEMNWPVVKQFAMDITQKLKVSVTGTHIGVVRFSNEVSRDLDLNGVESSDQSAIVDFIWALGFMAGKTNTADGLRMMAQVSAETGRVSVGATQIGVLITDGYSTVSEDDTIPMADAAKAAGMTLIVIGVTEFVNAAEIRAIASSTEDAYLVVDFPSLAFITDTIIAKTCVV